MATLRQKLLLWRARDQVFTGTARQNPDACFAQQSDALKQAAMERLDSLPETLVEKFRDRFDPTRVPAGAYADPRAVRFFLHVPKTAGSAFNLSLMEGFDRVHTLPFDWQEADLERVWRDAAARHVASRKTPPKEIIVGHVRYRDVRDFLRGEQPISLLGMIRNPADRMLSNFNYNTSDTHPNHERFRREYKSFEDYVDAELNRPDRQLLYLSGQGGTLRKRLKFLKRQFSFLGVTEHFAASLAHLERSQGLPPLHQYVSNTAPSTGAKARLTPELRAAICTAHIDDWALFALIEPMFEAFGTELHSH